MKEQLDTFIKNLKEDRRIVSFDEAATKQAIVLRLLSVLGWDTFNIDEVTPEYSFSGRKVDYSLRTGNSSKVFMEVKKIGEELEDHQEQLLNYAFQEGIKLAILTNGITWWFYLPLHEGSWEQRRFYTIDVLQQETEEIVSKFIDFLSKENITSGISIQNAETTYKSYKKQNILKETLSQAWNKIISDGDETLIELISETTEKLCGYKPDSEMVGRFISENKDRLLISVVPPTKIISRTIPKATRGLVFWKGARRRKMRIGSDTFEIIKSNQILINTAEWLIKKGKLKKSECPIPIGPKRHLINIEPKHINGDNFEAPKRLSNELYLNVNYSTEDCINTARRLLEMFGYRGDMLEV